MSRGGGRRVVKALDSPRTSKGCIMRTALISLFFYFPEVTLNSLRTAGAANVRQNVCSVVSHSRGYFGPVWVEFRWCILRLKHRTCARTTAPLVRWGEGEEMSAHQRHVQPLLLVLSAFSCAHSENRARLLV